MSRTSLSAAAAALALSVSPSALFAQTAPAPTAGAAGADICRELVTFLERRGNAQPAAPLTLDEARGFQRGNNVVACREGVVRIQGAGITLPAALVTVAQAAPAASRAGDGANIVVQQPAPTVQVQQAAPTVTVQQPQPTVTVQQMRPEIIVRQPQPTVTVDIPQPEIIVRMLPPDVNVAMAQPQVQVNQPPPQVQVVRPEQPRVEVQPAQAQVMVQRPAGAQANVQVQGAEQQPVVRYERAEPRVVVNQQQGQPQVRLEQMTAGASAGAMAGSQLRQVRASELTNMDVMNAQGQQIGDVTRLVRDDNQLYAVVQHGGRMGLGQKEIAVPLDRLTMHDGRLMAVGLTDDQIKAMPAFDRNNRSYREVEATAMAPLTVMAIAPAGAATATAGATAAAPAATAGQTRAFAVSALMDKELYNLQGQQLGDVERVLIGEDNKIYIVIGHGGFLGLGEKQILLPLERIQVRDDRLVISGLRDDQIRAMPEFHRNAARGYRDADRNQRLDVVLYRG